MNDIICDTKLPSTYAITHATVTFHPDSARTEAAPLPLHRQETDFKSNRTNYPRSQLVEARTEEKMKSDSQCSYLKETWLSEERQGRAVKQMAMAAARPGKPSGRLSLPLTLAF